MAMSTVETTLARRLGKTVHASPLRFHLDQLRQRFPAAGAACLEDWLIRVANARGARAVEPPVEVEAGFLAPATDVLPNEDLVVAICQPNCLDRPQMLRLAAQLVSRRAVDPKRLRLVAERERAEPVLAELARLALRIDPTHDVWQRILADFQHAPPPREPLLHWTRLAVPVPHNGRCNAAAWRLVA
jgi:hypothetical protein